MTAPTPPDLLQTALEMRSKLNTLISELQEKKNDYSIAQAKRSVLDHSFKLQRVVMGPMESLMNFAFAQGDLAALSMMFRHRWFDYMPASTKTLAEKSGVPEETISRLLKMLATHEMVAESVEEKDGVQESVWSLEYNGVGLTVEPVFEIIALTLLSFPTAYGRLVEYFDKYPQGSEKSNESVIWMMTGKSAWECMAEDKELEKRAIKGMEAYATADTTTAPLVAKWLKQHGKPGKVIDLGGGAGYISSQVCSIIPADETPQLTFELQDLFDGAFKQYVAIGRIPETNASRIHFRQHNFFEPQPQATFDNPISAIFLRFIIHDWVDADAAKILSHLIPVLEANPDAALLINDNLLPEAGDESFYAYEERVVRRMDMNMMVYANSKERMMSQFKTLFGMVDKRLFVDEVLWYNDSRGANCMPVIVVRLKV